MDSNTIRIGLMLIVLVWTVVSGITYMARRSGNKGALRELKQEGQPLRRMTAAEREMLQPFLIHPAGPRKTARLANDGIFPLRGAFVRHGISSNQGGSTMHDTLGGVDVVLPYDARDYLREDNAAEVAMTEKYAIVVALNGEFDLAGGRERDQRRGRQERQWSAGKTGAMQNIADPETEAPGAAREEDGHEPAEAMRVEILGQRDETPAEIADRRHPGIAFWISMLWLLVFAGLAATAAGGGAAFAGAAAAMAVLALWLTWRKRALGEPQKVNRARGELHAIVLTNPDNAQAVSAQLFLGDKLPVNLPDHWRATLELPDDGRVDVDMRVEDYSVVRLGGSHSVDEEQRLFPRVFWGRHATLALTGVLAGAALYASADSLKGDAALASAWLRGVPPRAYASAAELAQDPPGFGVPVSLQGRARCELRPGDSGKVDFDCGRLRWGGEAPQPGRLEVNAAVMQLYSGDFLKTRPNPMLDVLLASQIYGRMRDNPMAGYAARNVSALSVAGLSKTVLTIEQACDLATGESIAACDELKRAFAANVLLAKEGAGSWLELHRMAEEGAFQGKGRGDDGVMFSRYVDEVRRLARSSMHTLIEAALDRASRGAMETQRGGVVLRVLPGPYATLPRLRDTANEGLLAAWNQQLHVLSPDGAMPFEVSGMVAGAGTDSSGVPEIAVDAGRSLDDPWPSLARMAWLLLAGLLVLAHLPLAVVRKRESSARERGLREYAERRRAAKPAFF
ncbi:Intracellular growth attenuator protein igaA [compost metagenome]